MTGPKKNNLKSLLLNIEKNSEKLINYNSASQTFDRKVESHGTKTVVSLNGRQDYSARDNSAQKKLKKTNLT